MTVTEVHGPCGDGGIGEHGGPDDRHCIVCTDKTCPYNQPDVTRQHTPTHCHCGKSRGTSDHCSECGCEEYERTCSYVWKKDRMALPDFTTEELLALPDDQLLNVVVNQVINGLTLTTVNTGPAGLQTSRQLSGDDSVMQEFVISGEEGNRYVAVTVQTYYVDKEKS